MKNKYINIYDFYRLISSTPGGRISTNSLDQWLQLKTNQEFTVVEIAFLKDAIHNLETKKKNYNNFKLKWNLHLDKYS